MTHNDTAASDDTIGDVAINQPTTNTTTNRGSWNNLDIQLTTNDMSLNN